MLWPACAEGACANDRAVHAPTRGGSSSAGNMSRSARPTRTAGARGAHVPHLSHAIVDGRDSKLAPMPPGASQRRAAAASWQGEYEPVSTVASAPPSAPLLSPPPAYHPLRGPTGARHRHAPVRSCATLTSCRRRLRAHPSALARRARQHLAATRAAHAARRVARRHTTMVPSASLRERCEWPEWTRGQKGVFARCSSSRQRARGGLVRPPKAHTVTHSYPPRAALARTPVALHQAPPRRRDFRAVAAQNGGLWRRPRARRRRAYRRRRHRARPQCGKAFAPIVTVQGA